MAAPKTPAKLAKIEGALLPLCGAISRKTESLAYDIAHAGLLIAQAQEAHRLDSVSNRTTGGQFAAGEGFLAWVGETLPISYRTAYRYLNFAKRAARAVKGEGFDLGAIHKLDAGALIADAKAAKCFQGAANADLGLPLKEWTPDDFVAALEWVQGQRRWVGVEQIATGAGLLERHVREMFAALAGQPGMEAKPDAEKLRWKGTAGAGDELEQARQMLLDLFDPVGAIEESLRLHAPKLAALPDGDVEQMHARAQALAALLESELNGRR